MAIIIWVAVIALLVALGVETIRQFRKMDRHPKDFSGSDRFAGSAE